MLWLACRPVEGGGLGMQWQDAIRMNPAIVMFLLQDKQDAENAARRRNYAASGKTGRETAMSWREAMRLRRLKFAGVESRDEL